MGYIVDIQIGSRRKGNFTRTQSIPLPNKERVRKWVQRNPVGNMRTKVTIKNTKTKKITTTTKAGASVYGWKFKK